MAVSAENHYEGRREPVRFALRMSRVMLRCVRGSDAWQRPGLRVLVLLTSLLASSVLAQAAPSAPIIWSAPANCADQGEVERRVAAIIARPRWPADLRASGRVAARRGGFKLDLTIDLAGRHAARALTSPSCETLALTAAWLIAVSMDPNLALSAPAAAAENAPAEEQAQPAATSAAAGSERAGAASGAEAEPSKEQPAAPSTSAARPARTPNAAESAVVPRATKPNGQRALWGRAGAFTGLWSAGLPGPQVSLGARAGLGFGLGYLELRGAHAFARARRGPLGSVQVDNQELGIAGCAQWGDHLRGGPCLTLSALRTHARMDGARSGGDDVIFWANAGAGANLAYVVHAPLELHAEAGLSLPISARPRFLLRTGGELERASFLAGYAVLSVCVRIE
jgi:hypothetical protein